MAKDDRGMRHHCYEVTIVGRPRAYLHDVCCAVAREVKPERSLVKKEIETGWGNHRQRLRYRVKEGEIGKERGEVNRLGFFIYLFIFLFSFVETVYGGVEKAPPPPVLKCTNNILFYFQFYYIQFSSPLFYIYDLALLFT